jgi:hypothetical protein
MAFGDTALPPHFLMLRRAPISVNVPTTGIAYTVVLLFSEKNLLL